MATWLPPVGASVFVLGFTLVRGAVDSMWMDEAFSFLAAKRSLPSLLEFVLTEEPNMGPYYLTLWPWIRIDDGDLWVRSLSALFTIATVWAVWSVVRRWSGAGVAGVAAIVFALTPFVLAWSMQARGYTMSMAFTTWSVFFADRIRTGEGRWSALLFGAMVGLAVASQFATVFVFIGVVAALLALAPRQSTMRSLLMAGLAATAVFAPFSVAAILKPDHADWVPALTGDRFAREFDLASSGLVWRLMVTTGLVALLVVSWRTPRVRPHLMALAGAVTGLVGLVAFSILVRPLFVGRYLIGCAPLVVIAAAGGWSVLWPRWRFTLLAVVIGLSAVHLGTSIDRTRPTPEDYRSATAAVEEGLRPGDAIVSLADYPIIGVVRYLPEGTPTQKLHPAPERPGSWKIVDENGRELRPQRLWVVNRGTNTTAAFDAWINRAYPEIIVDEQFGLLTLQLRTVAGG